MTTAALLPTTKTARKAELKQLQAQRRLIAQDFSAAEFNAIQARIVALVAADRN